MFAARNAIDSRFVSVIVLISGAAWPRPCLRRALCPAAGRAPRQLRALVLPLSLSHGCRAGHRNLPALPVRGRDVIDEPESQERPHGHFGDGSISAGGARVAAGTKGALPASIGLFTSPVCSNQADIYGGYCTLLSADFF